jgi:hypothetical protein
MAAVCVAMTYLRQVGLILLLTMLFAGTGAGITTYDIRVDGDTAHVNVTFELYASLDADGDPKKINYWETTWSTPANAEITNISDSQGDITDYTHQGTQLRFKTNSGPRRTKEVVTVQMTVSDIVENQYRDLNLVRLQLSGFGDRRADVPDEQTQVTVETAQRLLSESHSHGFDHRLERRRATYKGAGPINLHLAVGEPDQEYNNYAVFGDANLSEADDLYWLAPALTGFIPTVNRHPVVVLPDSTYDEKVDGWSAGQYRTGGIIFLRKTTTEKDDMPAIVLHEVIHAFNEPALRWTNGGLGWFDEGTAKYAEYLVKHEKNLRQAEIFGEAVTWTGSCEDGNGRCRYTLDPRGTPDQLWNYYQQDGTTMYTWTPSSASSQTERRFGYAFGELLIRDYIRTRGSDGLHPVYDTLLSMNSMPDASARQKTEQVLDELGTDFTPCYDAASPSRNRFDDCLDTVNAMDPPVPSSVTINNTTHTITIDRIERPEASPNIVDPETGVRRQYGRPDGKTPRSCRRAHGRIRPDFQQPF